MKITTIALLAVTTVPGVAFAASPDPEGASGSIAGVDGGSSSSITSQDSNRGAAGSTDSSHNITNAPSLQNSPTTTGAGTDATSDMSGSGGANTGQKTTTTPKNAGPREPGDMTGGSPAR